MVGSTYRTMLLCGMDMEQHYSICFSQRTTANIKELQLEIKLHLCFSPRDTGELQSEWLRNSSGFTIARTAIMIFLRPTFTGRLALHAWLGISWGEGVHIATLNDVQPLWGWTWWFRFHTIYYLYRKKQWSLRCIMFWAGYMQQIMADYPNDLVWCLGFLTFLSGEVKGSLMCLEANTLLHHQGHSASGMKVHFSDDRFLHRVLVEAQKNGHLVSIWVILFSSATRST